jgi:hypothetical protein
MCGWIENGSFADSPVRTIIFKKPAVVAGPPRSVTKIGEAMTVMETTNERWCEAEIHRMAGEIALKSSDPDAAKAEAYFERALAVARKQQAKSWELRAAMSMARLWCDQGKRQQARELLAPVYGWFTEGFDTPGIGICPPLLNPRIAPVYPTQSRQFLNECGDKAS